MIEQAAKRISELLPNVVALDPTMPNAAELLANGTYTVLYGWSFDAIEGHSLNQEVEFVLPEEGPILWIDTFVVPNSSTRKTVAWQFINFVLQPEVSALITNEIYVATANDQAMLLIDSALRSHPWIFPVGDAMAKAEYIEQLPPEIAAYRHQLWQKFQDRSTR